MRSIVHTILLLESVLRISSGVKNFVIVIIAALFAGTETRIAAIILVSLSLTCITSAMYAYNALTDVHIDAKNPNKQHRAVAAKALPDRFVRFLIVILIIVGVCVSFLFSARSGLAHALLAGELFLYSSPLTRFKERPLLDIVFGAVLSFSFRYFGAWYALSAGTPPLWPLAALISAKCGGFMLYKELDRATLEAQGIRSSITLLSPTMTTSLAFLFIIIALGTTLFAIPEVSVFLPLAVLPLAVVLTQRFCVTHFHHRALRSAGLIYFFAISLFAWTLLS